MPTSHSPLPSLFVPHGAPTFALDPGVLGQALGALGRSLPKPRAVLVMSPHWMTDTLAVQTADHAPTVHDFGGFPAALYRLDYPAPTAPDLAAEVLARCQQHGIAAVAEANVGRDHGTWVPLLHLYPDADVPVIQLSLPATARPAALLALGQALSPLREQGVLIIGSGSMTHNLYERGDGVSDGYAQAFADWVAQHAEAGEVAALLEKAGVTVARRLVGNYITSLDMAGCSVTLLKADDELIKLWDAPVNTAGLRWGV